MADNVSITAGSGTSISTDDIGGVHYQRFKVTWGADGTANDTSTSNPLPVSDLPTGVADNRKVVTTAGTRVALAASTSCRWVIITAETDNTGIIVVGGASTVIASLSTRQGVPLNPGDSVSVIVDNLADIGLDSTVSGDGVTFMYGT